MKITYDDKADLLYIRFDDHIQDVVNKRISEDIVLDIGENNRIIGIEIMDASKSVPLNYLFPISYQYTHSSNIGQQPIPS